MGLPSMSKLTGISHCSFLITERGALGVFADFAAIVRLPFSTSNSLFVSLTGNENQKENGIKVNAAPFLNTEARETLKRGASSFLPSMRTHFARDRGPVNSTF